MNINQETGILLHITSLPSRYGIGDMGKEAGAFIDYLSERGDTLWQVLPLVPVGIGFSPYQGSSTFAGNHLLISPDILGEEGLLDHADLLDLPSFPAGTIDVPRVKAYKEELLHRAFIKFEKRPEDPDLEHFIYENEFWLPDFALFMALKEHYHDLPWNLWPDAAALREKDYLVYCRRFFRREIRYHYFIQHVFSRQWKRLREYAKSQGIKIIGDVPIYAAHNSSDVWVERQFFRLDKRGNPLFAAGVPPDEFNKEGQCWGMPVYNWERMKEDGYRWWRERITHILKFCDMVRLDHFRGFEAYWAVPAGEKTAVHGTWVKAPGEDFFLTLYKNLGKLPFIAEDLGFITGEVKALKEKLGIPGMQVLQFACEEGEEGLRTALEDRDAVFYTGTHDNDTILGWYQNCVLTKPGIVEMLKKVYEIDHRKMSPGEICTALVKIAGKSSARMVVIPLQDILSLDSRHRMNIPGTSDGNWLWRVGSGLKNL